jgi:hypothetical protein
LNKEIKKAFVENWLIQLLKQEVIIFEVDQLVHYPRGQKANASFLVNDFQVPQKVSLHYQGPYVHHKSFYTSRQEFLDARP